MTTQFTNTLVLTVGQQNELANPKNAGHQFIGSSLFHMGKMYAKNHVFCTRWRCSSFPCLTLGLSLVLYIYC